MRLWEKAQAIHPRSPALSISQPFVFSPRGSLSSQKPRARARNPAPSGGAEAGAEQKLEPGVRAWREPSSLLPSCQLSGPSRLPTDRGPSGRWLPGAPRTVTCHGDTAARPLPRSPSPGPRGSRSPRLPLRHPATERYRQKGTSHCRKPRARPGVRSPGAGVHLWQPEKTFLRATCTRSGHWACAVLRPACAGSPAFSRSSVGSAGGGAGKGRARVSPLQLKVLQALLAFAPCFWGVCE